MCPLRVKRHVPDLTFHIRMVSSHDVVITSSSCATKTFKVKRKLFGKAEIKRDITNRSTRVNATLLWKMDSKCTANLTTCMLMRGHIKNWTMRVQNRVKYRHPDSKFRSIPFCRGLFSPSRAYFRSRMSPLFCFKITNPGLQKRQIPYPHKPIGDPRQWISFSESCQCLGPNGVVGPRRSLPLTLS